MLNVAVVAGFPFGVAAVFWANRLLPIGLKDRAQWEVHGLFIAWALALALTCLMGPRRGWIALLGATGALLSVLPLYNAIATERGLPATLSQGDYVLAGGGSHVPCVRPRVSLVS